MTLMELKEQLSKKELDNSFKIFRYTDNRFLINQYIDAICTVQNKIVNKINSIREPLESALSLVLNYESRLNILEVDTFEERAEDYSKFEDIIVICSKIDKKLESKLEDYIIDFPKLEEWQIKDYMSVLCSSLSKQDIDSLYSGSQGDIYKIINEIDKLTLFEPDQRKEILDDILFGDASDLYTPISIFEVSDAMLDSGNINNYFTLPLFLKHTKEYNYDPIAISNIILNNLKKLILIKFNSGATAAEIGVSPKQYSAFKNYIYKGITAENAFKKLEFLANIDLRLKSSELDLSKERLLDYIMCNLY